MGKRSEPTHRLFVSAPEGRYDRSPVIHHWERGFLHEHTVPEGQLNAGGTASHSSHRDSQRSFGLVNPVMNHWAIVKSPSGAKNISKFLLPNINASFMQDGVRVLESKGGFQGNRFEKRLRLIKLFRIATDGKPITPFCATHPAGGN